MNKRHVEEDIYQLNNTWDILYVNTWSNTYKIKATMMYYRNESEIFINYDGGYDRRDDFIKKVFKEGVINIHY